VEATVSPLRASPLEADFPGLAPWTTIFRAYVAFHVEKFRLA